MDYRHREIQTPLHPAGECADARVAMSFQSHHGDQLVDSPDQLGSVHSVNVSKELQILRRGKLWVERYFLGRKTDHLANLTRLVACAVTEQDRISTGGPPLRREHRDRAGLAGSVRAEKAENFPFADVEVQSAVRDGCPVTLA